MMKTFITFLFISFFYFYSGFAQSGNGHDPDLQLSYTPTNNQPNYSSAPTMRQDNGFLSFTKPSINNNGGGTDLFVNFTFDTNNMNIYVVYTNDSTVPTKTNGENKTANFSNFDDPDRTWRVTINKVFNSAGDKLEYLFYISNSTLANAFGRVTPGGGYQTTWTEGDERGFTYTVHESNDTSSSSTDWSNASTWNESKPNSNTLVEIIGNSAITIDENANTNNIRIVNGATLNGSDGTNAYNLTISNNGELINNGTFDASDGKVIFDGDNIISGSTTTTLNDVDISGGVNFGGTFIDGTLDVLAGGFATTGQPPTYNNGSTLQFSTGGDYDITSSLTLWDNSGSGAGVPDNVIINTSELDLQEARTIAGNLTVNASGILTLENVGLTVNGDVTNDGLIDFQAGSQQPLTVEGNLTNNNSINLSDTGGGDLTLQGNFTDTGNFNTNGRAVFLTGGNSQSLDANTNITIDFLNIEKGGGSLQLSDNLSVSNILTLEDNNTVDINLNGHILTLEENPTIDAGNTGTIDGSSTNSTLELLGNVSSLPDGFLSGNSIQNLDLSGGTISIDTDLTINSSLNTSNGDHELPSSRVLTLNGALNVNSGTFTLKSESDGSNGSVSAQIANSTGSTFSGNVIVERFVPKSNRAFRYISSPVNTSGTINANLQEGVNNPDQSTNFNPNPGFGTHITGSSNGSNGFDATSTGNVSMFEWDESLTPPDWVEIPNTDTKTMNIDEAYALMVRGDRSTTLNSNTAVGPATTLRFTGTLVGGNQAVAATNLSSTSGNYNLVANPYQAIVDMKTLMESADATDLDDQTIYVYDPTLGTQGGYATIDLSLGNPTSTPAGTNADENILPNQAFFVETTGTSTALTFKETYKNTGANFVDTFSDDDILSEMHVNLKRQPEDVVVDGVTARFNPNHTNAVNNADADEVWNFDEWVALFNSDTYLSIEKRATPIENDSLQIYTGNYQSDSYVWQIDMSNIDREAVLVDAYLDTETPLNADDETSIAFDIDSNIPESADPFRFSIRFTDETLAVDDQEKTNFAVYPNPVTNNRFTVSGLQNSGNASVQLFNMTGKLVFTTTKSAENTMTINIDRSLPTGVYQLQITQDQTQYQSTLIISE